MAKDKQPKPDKYGWRGDADSYDTDAKGPGHVPESPDGQKYDTYNWAGEETNKWYAFGGKRDKD